VFRGRRRPSQAPTSCVAPAAELLSWQVVISAVLRAWRVPTAPGEKIRAVESYARLPRRVLESPTSKLCEQPLADAAIPPAVWVCGRLLARRAAQRVSGGSAAIQSSSRASSFVQRSLGIPAAAVLRGPAVSGLPVYPSVPMPSHLPQKPSGLMRIQEKCRIPTRLIRCGAPQAINEVTIPPWYGTLCLLSQGVTSLFPQALFTM